MDHGGRDESGKLIPIDVKVGDRILFGKWSGTEVKLQILVLEETVKRAASKAEKTSDR